MDLKEMERLIPEGFNLVIRRDVSRGATFAHLYKPGPRIGDPLEVSYRDTKPTVEEAFSSVLEIALFNLGMQVREDRQGLELMA